MGPLTDWSTCSFQNWCQPESLSLVPHSEQSANCTTCQSNDMALVNGRSCDLFG